MKSKKFEPTKLDLQIALAIMVEQKASIKQRGVVVPHKNIVAYAAASGFTEDKIREFFYDPCPLSNDEAEPIAYQILKCLAQKQYSRWSGTFDAFVEYTQADLVPSGLSATKVDIKCLMKNFIEK